jgi:hypothetical protein
MYDDQSIVERNLAVIHLSVAKPQISPLDADPVNPEETFECLDPPIRIGKGGFYIDPLLYKVDNTRSDREIHEMNKYYDPVDNQKKGAKLAPEPITWRMALLGELEDVKRFVIRWPMKPSSRLHVTSGIIHHRDFVFQTRSESMHIREFYARPKAKDSLNNRTPIADEHGEFSLSFTANQLRTLLERQVPGVGQNEYDVIPYRIELRNEFSNLPVTYHATLTAAAPRGGGSVQWSTPTGGHTMGKLNYDTGVTHHVIYREQRIQSESEQRVLFEADPRYNSAEFSRWINVDRAKLLQELEESRGDVERQFAFIPCPPETAVEAQTILQFVCIDEWERLGRVCREKNLSVPSTSMVNQQLTFKIPFEALEYVISDHLRMINRDSMVMKLDDLKLTLVPLRQKGIQGPSSQSIGENDIHQLIEKIGLAHTPGQIGVMGLYPSYACTIRIYYELYTGNQPSGSSNTNSSNSSSSISKTQRLTSPPGFPEISSLIQSTVYPQPQQ